MTESMWVHLFWVGGLILVTAIPCLCFSTAVHETIGEWLRFRKEVALERLKHEKACPRFSDAPRK